MNEDPMKLTFGKVLIMILHSCDFSVYKAIYTLLGFILTDGKTYPSYSANVCGDMG